MWNNIFSKVYLLHLNKGSEKLKLISTAKTFCTDFCDETEVPDHLAEEDLISYGLNE